jgi:beta-phosphoglucomutase
LEAEISDRPYQAAIFDLDGVIVDTAKYHYLAWKRLAGELGFEFTEEQNERLKGVSRIRSLEILLEIGGLKLDQSQMAAFAAKKNDWYLEYIDQLDESEILPGAKEYLLRLKIAGIKIALASASKNARVILSRLNICELFDAIVDGNMVSKAKPDPEVFLCAARDLCVDPTQCIVFEDAEAGLKAAKRAGMKAIGIGRKETLKSADQVFKSLAQVSRETVFWNISP